MPDDGRVNSAIAVHENKPPLFLLKHAARTVLPQSAALRVGNCMRSLRVVNCLDGDDDNDKGDTCFIQSRRAHRYTYTCVFPGSAKDDVDFRAAPHKEIQRFKCCLHQTLFTLRYPGMVFRLFENMRGADGLHRDMVSHLERIMAQEPQKLWVEV